MINILQVENGNFTSLVFLVNGGMGKEANKCYCRIAEKLAGKWHEPYSVMMYIISKKNSLCVFVEGDGLSMSEKDLTSKN